MDAIELQVGKTYEVREPNFCEERCIPHQITIIKKSDHAVDYQFAGDNYATYTKTGQFDTDLDGPFDLVKEINL